MPTLSSTTFQKIMISSVAAPPSEDDSPSAESGPHSAAAKGSGDASSLERLA
jgi:hypothetical protein